ncbi:hypothetical protein ACIPYQ_39340 [Streptomyces sp. NPDC090045]
MTLDTAPAAGRPGDEAVATAIGPRLPDLHRRATAFFGVSRPCQIRAWR